MGLGLALSTDGVLSLDNSGKVRAEGLILSVTKAVPGNDSQRFLWTLLKFYVETSPFAKNKNQVKIIYKKMMPRAFKWFIFFSFGSKI